MGLYEPRGTMKTNILVALFIAIAYNLFWYFTNLDIPLNQIDTVDPLVIKNSSYINLTNNMTKVSDISSDKNNKTTPSAVLPSTLEATSSSLNHERIYSFDDAVSYNGNVIESWPPSKNRSVRLYINEPFTLLPREDKLTNKTLLVIVETSPREILNRDKLRNSWMKYANLQTSVLFLLGKEWEDHDNAINSTDRVLEEQEKYGDIIQIEGLLEHYDNLTLKSLYAIKFFLEKSMFKRTKATKVLPKYFFKVRKV